MREKLDEIGDEIFSATGITPHPLSKLLMPFKEEAEFPPEEPEIFETAEEPTEEVVAEGENNPEAVAALPAPEGTDAELAQADDATTDLNNSAQGSSELDELQAAAEAMAAERLASENPTAKPEAVPTA